MEQLSAIALAIALVGGMHDLLTKKIPNWLTLPAMALGLLAQIWLGGWMGGLQALAGVAVAFALYFPVHFLGYMGAGDVKLLMAVGAWLGGRDCLHVAALAIVLGAAYALVEIIWHRRLLAVIRATYSFLRSIFVPVLVVEKLRLDENRKFAFGICVAGGVAGMIYLRHSGVWV